MEKLKIFFHKTVRHIARISPAKLACFGVPNYMNEHVQLLGDIKKLDTRRNF